MESERIKMEVKITDNNINMDCTNKEEDDVILPGFRFHPTDEELVGFYLRRKIERKSFTIDLIKHVDIYKYDPWDLPKGSNVGDKEWYFFCKRGRKYRNSVRPNRVTSSGFWKATGIDRPIYSTAGAKHQCIGLKKSLVYYRGNAGKGTKTEWMMHEFRLPADHDDKSTKHIDVKKNITTQEAEVWTLCRIIKRSTLTKKCVSDWRDLSSAKSNITPSINASSITCSADSDTSYEEGYKIDFRIPNDTRNNKSFASLDSFEANQICSSRFSSLPRADSMAMYSNYYYPNVNDLIKTGGWDDLKSAVDFDVDLSYNVNKSMYM